MTIEAFLQTAVARLRAAGIETARLDCLVLLEDELRVNRAHLLAHTDQRISSSRLLSLDKKIVRRSRHEPLAYIRGQAEFYGRQFLVSKSVLVPRPESERLIDLVKTLRFGENPLSALHIADVGAGSGCLGITAALELPNACVDFYDIDTSALAVARKNAARFRLSNQRVAFHRSNVLAGQTEMPPSYDVALANLPYVPNGYTINKAARHEPERALFGGEDGLELYRLLWKQIAAGNQKPRYVVTESLPFQHRAHSKLAQAAGYNLHTADDFAQCFSL